jgi:antitoxin component of MazEF toxin-antitoxin module
MLRGWLVQGRECSYGYYMSSRELKVARIGNSRGVRLPAKTLDRYGIGESVIMEERSDGILLRPSNLANSKLSWDETAREMASSREDWSEWVATDADGIDTVPWKQVAERKASYAAKRKK